MLVNLPIGIAVIVVILIVAVMAATSAWLSRYRKAGPDEALVISGRAGNRVIRNGGTFVLPVLEQVGRMSLHTMSTTLTTDAMTKEGVPVRVQGTALVKVASTNEGILSAAERYLHRNVKDIEQDITNVLEGHLRGVCGQLTPEEIYQDRAAFQEQIVAQAQSDLTQLGLQIDSFTLQDVGDKEGYYEALGKKRVAEVKRDARIAQAIAEREATVAEADARREREERLARAEIEIGLAVKERDVQVAKFSAETRSEQARAVVAEQTARAQAEQEVARANARLAQERGVQREQELIVEIQRPAEAQKKKTIVDAEAAAEARRRQIEVQRFQTVQEAQAQAEAVREKSTADADAVRMTGNAHADATRAQLVGQADGTKAQLLAEAEGLERRAEALGKFQDESIRLELAKQFVAILPELVRAAGTPLSSVDSIRLVDFGGSGNGGSGPIDRLLSVSPQTLMKLDEIVKAATGRALSDFISLPGKPTEIGKGDTVP